MHTSEALDQQPSTLSTRRPSSVSQALRAIDESINDSGSIWEVTDDKSGAAAYRFRVVNKREDRERAYALAHTVYKTCGYVSEETGLCVAPYDAQQGTYTLLAEDTQGHAVGTITLVFDSAHKLPCDELYSAEADALREAGRLPVEVTRLAIAEDHRNSKALLVRLFNFTTTYAIHVRGFTDFLIEVNPRHVNYYRRLLCFEVIGSERPCPRVNGAPAVLMRLDLAVCAREIQSFGGTGAAAKQRTLFPWFYASADESRLARFLARNHQPMSAEDARYFGIEPLPLAAAQLAVGAL